MYLYLKDKKIILQHDVVFVNHHYEEDEFGNISEAITDDIVFKFSMPTKYFKLSLKPELAEKYKEKKRIFWSYVIALDQKANLSDKLLSINTGINKIFVDILKPMGFTYNEARVIKTQNDIVNAFLNFYGDKKSQKGEGE